MSTNARLPALVLAAAVCLLLGETGYQLTLNANLARERQASAQQLDGLALSLEATLSRHESLPGLLALDPSLLALLREPGNPARQAAANAYLEAAQQGAAVAAAYLLTADGRTLAASNWRQPQSFVGHQYAFRPYFREALAGGLGRFYGVGVTTGEPGYFLAAPVREGNQVRGVVALKLNLDALEQALASAGDTLLLADGDGVVFLSSARRWRYHTLTPLPAATAARLASTRQYGGQPIPPLANQPVPLNPTTPVRLALAEAPARDWLVHSRPVGGQGWRLVQLGDPSEARAAAWAVGAASVFASAFVLGLAAHLRHRQRRREELRRVYAELEDRIAERTADLTGQIAALERTKAILRETRDAAVQAGKLATLGQMSAGVSHELSQPLAALHTFADNAQALLARGRYDDVAENLQMISELIDRTGRIVRQLKSFARQEAATPQPVSVASAIHHALMMLEPRRRELQAMFHVEPCGDLQLLAEAGRLEQVLVNLLRNGLDAMHGQTAPQLHVRAWAEGAMAHIAVRDHGPGLSADAQRRLFEPFYTTKPAGEGLGLGLAISLTIVESYGGALNAHNMADGGAEFVLSLPTSDA
ncbi:sensor histidine kinase [Rivihabitans pingtungensis]|uniref:C4-dicarboxylate transport sensor protein DctB n=1 Tax=Rivihabitans pingtungensis TaxID=1054498 RepID=A0A318KJ36_9NEIS|nr:ATP-binding protein [Rivihabitans pingtungensis]PXX76097.1 two-component system C4-dicarboxylate transport sensor histidine kinase DctB [Rivihabitans pingtungensis]